jgi:hypothetical protein
VAYKKAEREEFIYRVDKLTERVDKLTGFHGYFFIIILRTKAYIVPVKIYFSGKFIGKAD